MHETVQGALYRAKLPDSVGKLGVVQADRRILATEVTRLQALVKELQVHDFYWDDRCLEECSSSLEDAVCGDDHGDIIELRPIHELPKIFILITDELPVIHESRKAAEAARAEADKP